MNTIKKLTASLLIFCMFLRLPQSEAMASEAADNFIAVAMDLNDPPTYSVQADCTKVHTIFSPCNTVHMKATDINGDGSLDMFSTRSKDQSLFNDIDQILPWDNGSEPPQLGFLIPVLHF